MSLKVFMTKGYETSNIFIKDMKKTYRMVCIFKNNFCFARLPSLTRVHPLASSQIFKETGVSLHSGTQVVL